MKNMRKKKQMFAPPEENKKFSFFLLDVIINIEVILYERT